MQGRQVQRGENGRGPGEIQAWDSAFSGRGRNSVVRRPGISVAALLLNAEEPGLNGMMEASSGWDIFVDCSMATVLLPIRVPIAGDIEVVLTIPVRNAATPRMHSELPTRWGSGS